AQQNSVRNYFGGFGLPGRISQRPWSSPRGNSKHGFSAAAVSLRGCRGLPSDLAAPVEPEEINGAKEWLSTRMGNRPYASTIDQTALTNQFDLTLARQAPSFDKCYRDITSMLEELRTRQ